MNFKNLFKSTSKKAVTETEHGYIMLLEHFGLGDVVDDAQISKYEEALTRVSQLAAKAKGEYDVALAEFKNLNGSYDSKLSDAERLQAAIESDETSPTSKKKFEDHLEKLLGEIESVKPDLDTKKQDMNDSKEHYETLKELVEIKANQLSKVKDALAKARRENQNLDAKREQIMEREKETKEILGIRENSDSVDSIVGAINANNSKKRQDIESAKLRVDALQHQIKTSSSDIDIDPEVAAILGKEKSGSSTTSTADRLAALRRK